VTEADGDRSCRSGPAEDYRPAPLVGQDGRAILGEIGYGDTEVDALIAAGALAVNRPDPGSPPA
jgi:hypothetical protein